MTITGITSGEWAWRMHLLFGPRLASLSEYRPDEDFEPVVFDVADDPLAEQARLIAQEL